ncbi:hypothetical protein ACHAWU_001999 [Discostella pseudostelligera]|uniref:WD40 repeat-like protein n=1 Tax=Discostella pseudostelligera TaxID=259834 RepID=A0ABD3MH46_9STRA
MASSSDNTTDAIEADTDLNDDDDDIYDETPTFIDMNSAVEVDVPDNDNIDDIDDDDDDVMMDDDEENNNEDSPSEPVIDQSKLTFSSHTDAVYAIASHYDSTSKILSIVSGGGDDRAYLHRINLNNDAISTSATSTTTTTIPLSHPHTDSISTVSFNTPYITSDTSGKLQANLIGIGSYDGSILLYNTLDGTKLCHLEGPSDVEFLTFHPKGGTVLLAGSIGDGTIWMYHIPSKSCLQVFVGHTGGVTSGAFTPDGKWVVSVGQDGTCRVWAPKTGVSKHVFRLMGDGNAHHGGYEQDGGEEGGGGGGLTCLAVGGGPDGQLAICGGEDGNAYVVHISGKKLVAKLPHFEESSANNNTTSKSNAKDNMEDEDDEDIMEEEEGEARSIEAVGFCPANITGTAHWCATGGVDGILKIWNTNVGGSGSGAQLRQRCVRTDNNDAAAGGGGGTAGITKLAWHATLPMVICSYTDGVIGIWDVRIGKLVALLTGHEDMINDMSVSYADDDGGMMVVTGSDDKMVKLFEFHP